MSFFSHLRAGGGATLTCERKFAGPESAVERVAAILSSRCQPDAEHPKNRICSIYFDTPSLSSLAEKENGDALKRKIRLRWYDDENPPSGTLTAYLEVKYRLCAARSKSRLEISLDADYLKSVSLDDPSLATIVERHARELGEPISLWSAVCCVSYDRMRFFDPVGGSRVSLDWNISASRVNQARFPWISPPVTLGVAVCEFKNPGGVPPAWAESVARAGFVFGSFSKYGELAARLARSEC